MYLLVAPGSIAQPSVTLLAEPLVLDPSSLGANGALLVRRRGAARGLAQPARRAGTRRQTTAATWGYFQLQKGPSSGHVPRLGGCKGVPRAVRLGPQVSGRCRWRSSGGAAAVWLRCCTRCP